MHIRSALLLTLILSNSGATVGLHLHDAASELIGSVCLSLLLTRMMMRLLLGEAVRLTGLLMIILAA
jgi:glutamate:Na+ symporter, ESS family